MPQHTHTTILVQTHTHTHAHIHALLGGTCKRVKLRCSLGCWLRLGSAWLGTASAALASSTRGVAAAAKQKTIDKKSAGDADDDDCSDYSSKLLPVHYRLLQPFTRRVQFATADCADWLACVEIAYTLAGVIWMQRLVGHYEVYIFRISINSGTSLQLPIQRQVVFLFTRQLDLTS